MKKVKGANHEVNSVTVSLDDNVVYSGIAKGTFQAEATKKSRS